MPTRYQWRTVSITILVSVLVRRLSLLESHDNDLYDQGGVFEDETGRRSNIVKLPWHELHGWISFFQSGTLSAITPDRCIARAGTDTGVFGMTVVKPLIHEAINTLVMRH